MKKVTSVVIALITIFSFTVTSFGTAPLPNDDSVYELDEYKEAVFERYSNFCNQESGLPYLFNGFHAYPELSEDLKNNKVFQAALESAQFLTEKSWGDVLMGDFTNDDLKTEYYVTALSSLLMTMEDNLADTRVNQAKATTSKNVMDYVTDIGSITANALSTAAGNSSIGTAASYCGIGIDAIADTLNSVERYESLQLNADKYVSYRSFLTVLKNNSDNKYLTDASDMLIHAIDKIYSYSLESFEDWADISVDALSNQFFMEIDEIIKNGGEDVTDIMPTLKALSFFSGCIGDYKLGIDAGKLLMDVMINSSDTIQRYYEICAMTECREALISAINTKHSNIKNADDFDIISENVDLLENLNCVNMRGSYCVYHLLTKDMGLLNLLSDKETLEEWYGIKEKNFSNYLSWFNLIIPNIENYISKNSKVDEKTIYNDFLNSGGYEKLLMNHYIDDVNEYEIKTYLIDFTGDGINELFLDYKSNIFWGARDYDRVQFVLKIVDGNVELVSQQENGGGGTAGGMNYEIRKDNNTGKYVLVNFGYLRDGNFSISSYLNVIEFKNSGIETSMSINSNSINTTEFNFNPTYEPIMERIKAETDLYYEDDQYFRSYKLDDDYISKEKYEALYNNYQSITDGEIELFTSITKKDN